MKKVNYDLILTKGLMNSSADGHHTFFDKDLRCLVLSKNDKPPKKYAKHDIVLCPYNIVPSGMVWKKFYEIISDKEREIIASFEGGMGFCDFLRETSIYETRKLAEKLVIEEIFEAWMIQNDINVNWNHVGVL